MGGPGTFQDFILWPPGTDGKAWEGSPVRHHGRCPHLARWVGFPKDASGLTTEIAQIQAVETEMVDSLLSGALPDWEATYATFIEKLRAAGVDRVREALQSQIDAWRAS